MSLQAWIYELALHSYAIATLPLWLWQKNLKKKKSCSFAAKLGRGFPKIKPSSKPLIWVHAVSLGELKAIEPVLKAVKSQAVVLLTTTTHTGYEYGLSLTCKDYLAYLPFDFRYLITPLVNKIKPSLLILSETDFWMNFQRAIKKNGGKLILVNGKLSERSFARYKKCPWLVKPLMGCFDHYYVQSEVYKQRFKELGLNPDSMTAVGNLKNYITKPLIAPEKSQPFTLTLGSTHKGEELEILQALSGLPIQIYVAPRHPERFDAVCQSLEKAGIAFGRYSCQQTFKDFPVIVIDKMGVLGWAYERSHVAFVGGTFVKEVGGHNLLEPLAYGAAVMYGPHTWGQADMRRQLESVGSGVEVNINNLKSMVEGFLQHPEALFSQVTQGQSLFLQGKCTLDTVMLGVNQMLC